MIDSDPGAVPNNPPVFWLLLDFSPKNKGRGFLPSPGLHLRAIESGCKQMLSSAKTFPLLENPKKVVLQLIGKSQEDGAVLEIHLLGNSKKRIRFLLCCLIGNFQEI